jgi:glycosyltransferase involved in cell wall biosynthesis
MKIVCISASQVPSDTANSLQAMKACQALAQLGHAVTLLVPGNPGQAISERQLSRQYGLSTPFEVRRLPVPLRRLFPWLAVRRARRIEAQALYVWPVQAAVLGLQAGLPVLLEMHDFPGGRFGPFWYRRFLKTPGCKRLLVITRALKAGLERVYGTGLPPGEVVIAPNGVDLERFAALPDPPAARRQLGLPEALTVACTGHLYAGRGAELFLALAGKFPQVRFLWAGGRPQEVEQWRARAAAGSLENVTFTGFLPNEQLPLYQAAAEVLLMPYGQRIAISSGMGCSAEISSPMKMFEYLASGRAILTSDLPVIREVLDETTAVFCPPEQTAAWESALGELLRDPIRRQTLGREARQAAAGYTWRERARRCLVGMET